jgi:hypothetical protein
VILVKTKYTRKSQCIFSLTRISHPENLFIIQSTLIKIGPKFRKYAIVILVQTKYSNYIFYCNYIHIALCFLIVKLLLTAYSLNFGASSNVFSGSTINKVNNRLIIACKASTDKSMFFICFT